MADFKMELNVFYQVSSLDSDFDIPYVTKNTKTVNKILNS